MSDTSLRIVHCFRSPVGGIFRHVRDLVAAQSEAGHSIGIVCDSSTGGSLEEAMFADIMPHLALGLRRFPMRRAILPSDIAALYRTYRHISELKPDVVHSHGAKGGAYARVIGTLVRASGRPLARLYCPHGGVIHYDPGSLRGKAIFAMERFFERLTDRLIFVSAYEQNGYREKIGEPRCPTSLIHNGLGPADFETVAPAQDAADFLYVGMMRDLKGPDLFLAALAQVAGARPRPATAAFVGDGPDKERYVGQIARLGLEGRVSVHPSMPIREAFSLGRTVVVPSRAESMPYVVLEAIAAGRPIIATRVGGIPEILACKADRLIEPDSVEALAAAMAETLDRPEDTTVTAARREMARRRFSSAAMAQAIDVAYRQCLG